MPQLPEGILVWNPIEAFGDVIKYGLYGTVFSFILVTLFDTTGTMIGVAKQAGILKDDKLPRARQAFLGDSWQPSSVQCLVQAHQQPISNLLLV